MKDLNIFLCVDLQAWVFGTIKKVQQGADWNHAWLKTYWEIGGKKLSSGKKECPMKAAETLYLLGRIKGSNMPFKNPPLRDILANHSKNGVYAITALEILSRKPDISLSDLWRCIQMLVESRGEIPAHSNQGGPTVAFKLFHLGLINVQ